MIEGEREIKEKRGRQRRWTDGRKSHRWRIREWEGERKERERAETDE